MQATVSQRVLLKAALAYGEFHAKGVKHPELYLAAMQDGAARWLSWFRESEPGLVGILCAANAQEEWMWFLAMAKAIREGTELPN